MIKIATIEDEENIRQEIVRYIKKGIGSIEGVEVDVYESAERYLLVGGRYDLVISDIELPGISGLELGKRIKENNPDVYLVFLTSHSEFASESYIIEAYQYILKKDIEERLSPLIERVVHEIKKDYEEYRWVGTNQRKIKISAISLLIVLSGMFIIKYQVVKQEKTTLILRDQLLEERYAEMLKSRQMIHDMKNHLLVLRNMERANQWDKLHDYLEEISKDILDDSTKIWTGNNIVDLILNSKKKQADSEGIAFSIGSNMIGDVPFKDGETISLLGNLLDNAIEACERIKSTEKWVTIRINRRYCLLYIEIENSIEEHPKEKNHRLISCKSEKEVHGYGLKNVRQIVDRYDGTYSYQIKENSFLTCVSFFSNEDVS